MTAENEIEIFFAKLFFLAREKGLWSDTRCLETSRRAVGAALAVLGARTSFTVYEIPWDERMIADFFGLLDENAEVAALACRIRERALTEPDLIFNGICSMRL